MLGSKVQIPTIHLNGTSKERLLEALCDAVSAIQDAVPKLAECAPNGRDYYTQPHENFIVAQADHQSRMHKLADVIRELTQIGEAIS